jgi:Transglutaminase-like superfamily
LIIGNIISAINRLKNNNITSILEPSSNNFKEGSPFFVFMISDIIEGLPSRIPMPFRCYERALTARFVFNLCQINSVFYIGFNPNTQNRNEKLHAWLGTDVCDVCGFSIKDKYIILKKYE